MNMVRKKEPVLLGAHMSIAGGFENALYNGQKIQCTSIQIFTKSNRQWHAKAITNKDIEVWNEAYRQCTISPVVAHASYLINLASPKSDLAKKSTDALIKELERCELLNIKSLVVHPGSRLDMPLEKALHQTAHNIDRAIKAADSSCNVIIETMAGQGSSICSTLEEIATVIQAVTKRTRIGVCVDTCHIFAAGYQINTKETYQSFWHSFDSLIGLEHLSVLHVNDSKKPLGSHVDRHEDIGKGKIGLEAFKMLMNDSRFTGIPKILETPKECLEDDRKNMEQLLQMIR